MYKCLFMFEVIGDAPSEQSAENHPPVTEIDK